MFYKAIFTKTECGRYAICFPELPGAISCGDDFDDAMMMAKECLELVLQDEESVDYIPILEDNITIDNNEFIVLLEGKDIKKKVKKFLLPHEYTKFVESDHLLLF